MKKIKSNKGITLIPLIITVIILLILAVVSINLVMNDGVIGKSEEAVNKYSEEQMREKISLAYTDYTIGRILDNTLSFGDVLTEAGIKYDELSGSEGGEQTIKVTTKDGKQRQYVIAPDGSITVTLVSNNT